MSAAPDTATQLDLLARCDAAAVELRNAQQAERAAYTAWQRTPRHDYRTPGADRSASVEAYAQWCRAAGRVDDAHKAYGDAWLAYGDARRATFDGSA